MLVLGIEEPDVMLCTTCSIEDSARLGDEIASGRYSYSVVVRRAFIDVSFFDLTIYR